MKTLQIRNVPDDVHAVVRDRAKAAGMSISQYLLREVSTLATTPTIKEVLARVAAREGGASDEAIMTAMREVKAEIG